MASKVLIKKTSISKAFSTQNRRKKWLMTFLYAATMPCLSNYSSSVSWMLHMSVDFFFKIDNYHPMWLLYGLYLRLMSRAGSYVIIITSLAYQDFQPLLFSGTQGILHSKVYKLFHAFVCNAGRPFFENICYTLPVTIEQWTYQHVHIYTKLIWAPYLCTYTCTFPQARQWCLLKITVNSSPQTWHIETLLSGTITGAIQPKPPLYSDFKTYMYNYKIKV